MFDSMFWPFNFMFAGLIALVFFIIWIWAIVDCAKRKKDAERLLWIIIIVFAGIIGAIFYFIFRKKEIKFKKMKGKKLYRSRKSRVIAGICGGIGEYFNVDPTLIRLLWVVFTLMGGSGIIAYIICWIVIPERP